MLLITYERFLLYAFISRSESPCAGQDCCECGCPSVVIAEDRYCWCDEDCAKNDPEDCCPEYSQCQGTVPRVFFSCLSWQTHKGKIIND